MSKQSEQKNIKSQVKFEKSVLESSLEGYPPSQSFWSWQALINYIMRSKIDPCINMFPEKSVKMLKMC